MVIGTGTATAVTKYVVLVGIGKLRAMQIANCGAILVIIILGKIVTVLPITWRNLNGFA